MARPSMTRSLALLLGLLIATPGAAEVVGTWQELAPEGSAPAPRMAMSVAYDVANDRVIVFGGYGFGNFYNDTWALELSPTLRWVRLAEGASISGRHETTAILDPVGERMLVFGGKDLYQFYGDLLDMPLSGSAEWSAVPQGAVAPGPRETRAVLDAARRRLVTVLGYTHPMHLDDTWAFDLDGGTGWTPLAPAGPGPSPRRGHTAVLDPDADRLLVFGGYDDQQFMNELWSLDLAATAWSPLAPLDDPPSRRYGQNAVLDPERRRVVMFGGYGPIGRQVGDSSSYFIRDDFLDDTWALELHGESSRWVRVTAQGGPPVARDFYGMVWDPARKRVLVLCGNGPDGQLSDVWEMTFSSEDLPSVDATPGTSNRLALVGARALAHGFDVSFRLEDARPARLDAFDAAGRRVGSTEVGSLGPGEHTVRLARNDGAPSGLCWVRLTRGAESRVRKVFFVR